MSYKIIQFLLIATLFSLSFQFFDKDTQVVQLNEQNFNKEVIESDELWLILFYAPWCGHCKAFHPQFEKVSKATKGLFKIGAVNCEVEKKLSSKYRIEGYPTVLFFGKDKKKTEEYEGDRKAEKVIEFLFEKAKNITSEKLKEADKKEKEKKEKKDTDL